MAIIYSVLMVFFLLTCLLMILVILLQPGKSDIASLGGSGGGFMGGGGATSFLSKLTSGLAIAYMVMVIVLGKLAVGTFTEVGEAAPTIDVTTTPEAAPDAGAAGDTSDADSETSDSSGE